MGGGTGDVSERRTRGAGNYREGEVCKGDIETKGDYMQAEVGVGEWMEGRFGD